MPIRAHCVSPVWSSCPDLECLKAVNSVAPAKASASQRQNEVAQMTNQQRLRDSSACSAKLGRKFQFF